MLPSGYKRLAYIESTGTQYIDDGLPPDSDTKIVCVLAFAVTSESNYIFGARAAYKDRMFDFAASKNGYYSSQFGEETEIFDSALNSDGFITVVKDRNVTTIDGTGASNTISDATFTVPVNVVLFGGNINGTVTCGKGKIKSYQRFSGSTLIRSLIPAKSPDGTAGMYDLVNDAFYTNAGTGVFVEGPEIAAPTLYSLSENSVTIQWAELTDEAEYLVYRDGAYIGTTTSTMWTDDTVQPYSRYIYHFATADYQSDSLAVETPGTTLPELITDRTKADIDTAKRIIEKLLAGKALSTGEQRAYDSGLRGCYNASDATRVELHTRRLQRIFNENGYSIQISTRMWAMSEYMRYDDIVRYLDNIRTLVAVFGKSGNTPDVPDISRWIDYIVANDIESILRDLSELAAGAIAMFRVAGTFSAGNDYILQVIRR